MEAIFSVRVLTDQALDVMPVRPVPIAVEISTVENVPSSSKTTVSRLTKVKRHTLANIFDRLCTHELASTYTSTRQCIRPHFAKAIHAQRQVFCQVVFGLCSLYVK